jgi:hypothetical protein
VFIKHLNQLELARRWAMSPRSLERWRWAGAGPPFLKLGGRILYRERDIESFEAERLRRCTSMPSRAPRG